MKILVIEDELKTAQYLQKGLGENGYAVETCQDGALGLALAASGTFDLIILDVQLPHCDGWTILGALRQNDRKTPVLFLTGRDSVQDRVKGLELGADDYLIKPFAFSELLARTRSLLRRGQVAPLPDVLRIADIEIDPMHQRVKRAGIRLSLTQQEFALLALLARHCGEILSRTMIAEQIWNMNYDSDTNVVDVAIRRLRKKVDDPFDRRLIRSVRGVGYVLEE
ncbi:MAG: heavy metal response regulator transcription factor [Hydrogenophilaceae bacterium]